MITNLASLLAPASAGDVVSAMSARRRLFVRAPDPRRFAELLPWPLINTLFFANRFAEGQVRVIQASTTVPPSMYRDPADPLRLKLDALQSLAAQGISIVVNGVDKLVPTVAAVSTLLERHLRGRTWVNAYLSFGKQSAFRPHWDGHDVVVLHLHGRKRWRSYGMGSAFPANSHVFERTADPGPVLWEDVLAPGDVLFLPRGEVHAAELEPGAASVHLTVGIQPPRGSDVLDWIAQGADEALRMDVLPCWDADERQRHETRLKEALHRLVDGLDLRDFFADADRARDHRPAANLGVTLEMHAGTWLCLALPRAVAVRAADAGFVTVTAGGDSHRLTATAGAILGLLHERNAMTIATVQSALAGVSVEDVRGAAAGLAQKGLIFVAADDPVAEH